MERRERAFLGGGILKDFKGFSAVFDGLKSAERRIGGDPVRDGTKGGLPHE
jgi:hypothetical protein